MAAPPSALALRRRAERAIARAEEGRSRLPPAVLELEGYSSPTVRHFLNNLCGFPSANYLEVGTWKGSTLIAASYGNPGRFSAVDDFSHALDKSQEAGSVREHLRKVRRRFRRHCRVRLHDANCWDPRLLQRLPAAINVFFYDGPHSYADQYRAFTHYEPLLSGRYLAVVDDWNRPYVRQATRQALRDLGHRVSWRRELRSKGWIRQHLSGQWEGPHWFNGLLVAVVEKPRPARGRA